MTPNFHTLYILQWDYPHEDWAGMYENFVKEHSECEIDTVQMGGGELAIAFPKGFDVKCIDKMGYDFWLCCRYSEAIYWDCVNGFYFLYKTTENESWIPIRSLMEQLNLDNKPFYYFIEDTL